MRCMSQPDIIVLLSDQHRGQTMSWMGDRDVATPVMDRLAGEGCGFRRAYANCPVCTPSRGTLLSGRHAHAGPVQHFFDVFKPRGPSLAHAFARAGWRTAWFGKWHLGGTHDQQAPGSPPPGGFPNRNAMRTPEFFRAGFQDWAGVELNNDHFNHYIWRDHDTAPTPLAGYSSDGLTDAFLDYLERRDQAQPLFATLSINQPHFPLLVPDRWRRHDPAALTLRGNCPDLPAIRGQLATYLAMIENVDWNLGRVFDAVQRRGRDTLLVYLSDHGEFLGSHGRVCRKEHPYEEAVRIPALFRWPGRIPARGGIDGLFSLVDLMPTLLGLAGLPQPAHLQGHDWSPATGAGWWMNAGNTPTTRPAKSASTTSTPTRGSCMTCRRTAASCWAPCAPACWSACAPRASRTSTC
jgi:arylsulfatase A-like enzyme